MRLYKQSARTISIENSYGMNRSSVSENLTKNPVVEKTKNEIDLKY